MAAGLAVLTKRQEVKKIKQIRRTRRKGEGERAADEWFSSEGYKTTVVTLKPALP
jgi:hypothetical protein